MKRGIPRPMPESSPAAGEADYDLLEQQVDALLAGERSFLANTSNFAAFMYTSLPQVNWAGFYFPHPGALVLGPFGGRPACTRLPSGRGVCGKAFETGRTVIVDDVSKFADHIVCDSASQSELVVPLLKNDGIYGVFDIDAPVKMRFTERDRDGIERLVLRFLDRTPIPEQFRVHLEGTAHIAERIDIQTCRDHHVVLQYLIDDINEAKTPQKLGELLFRFKSVLLTHLRLEDGWLYPRLQESENVFIREKALRYHDQMGGLRRQFMTMWRRWSAEGAIEKDEPAFRKEWTAFAVAFEQRVHAEDGDLYAAAEADIS